MNSSKLRFAAMCAVVLALFVVMLGAYTRLTNAGLGCPDWPGCYGHMVLPLANSDLHTPIETGKAWTEMVHRYAAGLLAVLIVGMAVAVFRRSRSHIMPALILLFLVAFQAALGMWTVTLKLLPIVVMGHLLGGILIFACLCYFRWQLSIKPNRGRMTGSILRWRVFILLGILIVFCQIALGGWVSSNYAGMACIGFPRCNGQWLPILDFSRAFNVISSVGLNYQGGLLDHDARMTIQMVHRLGAYVTAIYVVLLSGSMLIWIKSNRLKIASWVAIGLVIIQFTLGVLNVVYLLPLWVAVAHNGVAALLLGALVSLYCLVTTMKGGVHAH